MTNIDAREARIYFPDGRVDTYADQKLAFTMWLTLPEGIRAAFRGANDVRLVYSWGYVDVSLARPKQKSR